MAKTSPYAVEPVRAYPRFVRPEKGRVVAGVAAGLSAHLLVDVSWVRLALAASSLIGGFGIAVYALLWVFTPVGTPPRPVVDTQRWGRPFNYLLVLAALFLWVGPSSLANGSGGGAFVAALLAVGSGAVIAWRAYDRDMRTAGSIASLVIGGTLVLSGVTLLAIVRDSGGVAGIIIAVLVAFAGVGILVVPLIARLLRSLVQERQDKAIADQRAEIAAHLHDSVLQTLALIQKRAGNPEEVSRLARSQERELRAWLYDAAPPPPPSIPVPPPAPPVDAAPGAGLSSVPSAGPSFVPGPAAPAPAPVTAPIARPAPASLFAAVNRAAGEVEDLFGVRIQPVTVGQDIPYSEAAESIVLAAREAMVNAAKHSGAGTIDVYAENLAGELSVYVRDRGTGFNPAAIPADRHGVRDSITGRMDRAGGTAAIKSAPGQGTEVALALALNA